LLFCTPRNVPQDSIPANSGDLQVLAFARHSLARNVRLTKSNHVGASPNIKVIRYFAFIVVLSAPAFASQYSKNRLRATVKTVQSRTSQGARVSSVLPMPRRILIADDEASIRRAVRAFIESRSQFEVCEAADGTEAFHKAVNLNPDLIVLDLSMPNANGVEVALLLRSRMPNTPVVLYTMFDDAFGKSPTRTLGIAAIVPKSDGVATLLGRIEALLEATHAVT